MVTVSDTATDAEIREAIRCLRAELLRRQRERASEKYLAAAQGALNHAESEPDEISHQHL